MTTKKAKAAVPVATESQAIETQVEQTSTMTDLGMLKLGTSKVFVNRIPSKANAVVVNYKNSENYYRISCVMPPTSYTIDVQDNGENDEYDDEDEDENDDREETTRFKIESPALLFMAQYASLPKPTIGTQFDATFSIFALNTTQVDHIAVKPYMLSNTYGDGRICMGGFNPTSLLKAFNIYWGSAFNDELFHHAHEMVPDYRPEDISSHVLNFHSHMLPKLQWKDLTHTICGKNHWAASRGADGVLVSDSQALLKHIPKDFWREDFNGTPVVITLATLKEDVWHFESGNYKFQLPLKNVTQKNTKKSASNVGLTPVQIRNRDLARPYDAWRS